LKIRAVSMRGPEGWKRTSNIYGQLGKAVGDPDSNGLVGLYSVPSLNPDVSLDQLAKADAQVSNFKGRATIHEPVDVNGVECFHVSGRGLDGGRQDHFGAVHGRDQVTFAFLLDQDTADTERQEIIDSVLASVQWG
jgi:hypothetical protein